MCGTLTKGTFSSRLLLSNQDKGCTPSVVLPLGPALHNLSTMYQDHVHVVQLVPNNQNLLNCGVTYNNCSGHLFILKAWAQWHSEDVRGPWTTDYLGPLPHYSFQPSPTYIITQTLHKFISNIGSYDFKYSTF